MSQKVQFYSEGIQMGKRALSSLLIHFLAVLFLIHPGSIHAAMIAKKGGFSEFSAKAKKFLSFLLRDTPTERLTLEKGKKIPLKRRAEQKKAFGSRSTQKSSSMGILFTLLKNKEIRPLFESTPEGQKVIHQVTGKEGATWEEFITSLHHPKFREFRLELQKRLREVDKLIKAFFPKIQEEDKAFAWEVIAEKKLNFDTSDTAAPFDPAQVDPAQEEIPIEKIDPESQARGQKQATRIWDRMNQCIRNMSEEKASQINALTIARRLAISEGITIYGYVKGAGQRGVKWKQLPLEMILAGVSSGTKVFLMKNKNATWFVRWIRVQFFDQARSALLDGVLYYYLPVEKDTFGLSLEDAAWMRYYYSANWNNLTSPISPTVYQFLTGLQCLYNNKLMAGLTFGIDLAVGLGTSRWFFLFRNESFHNGQVIYFPYFKWTMTAAHNP